MRCFKLYRYVLMKFFVFVDDKKRDTSGSMDWLTFLWTPKIPNGLNVELIFEVKQTHFLGDFKRLECLRDVVKL